MRPKQGALGGARSTGRGGAGHAAGEACPAGVYPELREDEAPALKGMVQCRAGTRATTKTVGGDGLERGAEGPPTWGAEAGAQVRPLDSPRRPPPTLSPDIWGGDASTWGACKGQGGRRIGPNSQEASVSHFLDKLQLPHLHSGANTYLGTLLWEGSGIMYRQELHKK